MVLLSVLFLLGRAYVQLRIAAHLVRVKGTLAVVVGRHRGFGREGTYGSWWCRRVECAYGKVFVPGGEPLCWINEGRKENEH